MIYLFAILQFHFRPQCAFSVRMNILEYFMYILSGNRYAILFHGLILLLGLVAGHTMSEIGAAK